MFPPAIDVYLNDHLAGSTLGSDLAQHIRDSNEGTPLSEVMASVCAEIDEDRETLLALMERMEIAKNPVKQAGAWLAEKAGRVKFGGLGSDDRELGTFLALESLALGIEGKADLWRALREVAGEHPPVAVLDLDGLIARAERQRATVERERLAAAARTLTAS